MLLPTMPLAIDVSAEMIDGEIVVPGIVEVYVISCPKAEAAMALPLPDAVY